MAVLCRAQRTVVRFVKFTDQESIEIDLPNASALGTQRHLITGQRFADKAHAAPPVNFSALLHPAQQPGFRITGWADATIRTLARAPVLCGCLLLQGFVRTLMVVVVQPALTGRCWAAGVAAGGWAVSALSSRCHCSCAPLSAGRARRLYSIVMSRLIHHALNRERCAGP